MNPYNNFLAPRTAVAFLAVFCAGAAAEEVVLNPDRDASVFSNSTGSSIGIGDLFVGRTGEPGNRRALVHFDLSGIPAGSTINGATLVMRVSIDPPVPAAQTANLHRLLADWGEGTSPGAGGGVGGVPTPATANAATWLHRLFNTATWTTPGGDFAAGASASAATGSPGSMPTWTGAGVTADVQAWLDNPASNFGWILIGNEVNNFSARGLNSREDGAALGPRLTIDYTPPAPEPAPLKARAKFANPGSNGIQQSFLRLINLDNAPGTVAITAIDDNGAAAPGGELEVSLTAQQTVHYTAQELESGAAEKGLIGALGGGTGKWSLEFRTELDILVMSQIRTPDGFLTSVSELAPHVGDTVPLYFANPGSNQNQQSFLRVLNTSEATAQVTMTAVDDAGVAAPGGPVMFSIPPQGAQHLNSLDYENGNAGKGLTGGLGSGQGKWTLTLTADQGIDAMSLIRTPDGFLTNLSGIAGQSEDGSYDLYFVNPVDMPAQETFLRVINLSDATDTVTIVGTDDAGAPAPGGNVTFELGPRGAQHMNSADLEQGNPGKGLTGMLGDGTSRWSLSVASDLPLAVMGMIRTSDGFVTNMSEVVPPADETGTLHEVYFFNPGSNPNQRSSLRVINDTDQTGNVTVSGIDDAGLASPLGSAVFTLGPREAREYSAMELEQGDAVDGLVGQLGDGDGKWRLSVESEMAVKVMSIMDTPTGFITNMSVPAPAP